MTRILFATDIHGSDYVFRKFLNALQIYKINVGILLGDLSGKLVIPLIKNEDNSYTFAFLGEVKRVREDQLDEIKKKISITGYYPVEMSKKEFDEVSNNPDLRDKIFIENIKDRLSRWIKLAEERLRGKDIRLFISAGNDDPWEIEEILDSSDLIVNAGMKRVEIDEYHEMITLPHTNPTPWNTPREVSEDQLTEIIESLVKKVNVLERCIFNFHAPPYGTPLDLAPKLSKDLTPSVSEMVHVGSIAVLEAIKKYQPLLGLHGHIHESKGSVKIGRTLCLNPGSEYGEGIMKGVILDLEKDKVKNFMFVSG